MAIGGLGFRHAMVRIMLYLIGILLLGLGHLFQIMKETSEPVLFTFLMPYDKTSLPSTKPTFKKKKKAGK